MYNHLCIHVLFNSNRIIIAVLILIHSLSYMKSQSQTQNNPEVWVLTQVSLHIQLKCLSKGIEF